ncbi:hypothetical protein BGZ83_010649 [Gryganskiella cystojenkinii]|nr:hypothetical protein BGZ83_010649 [Gryganskiella cystojenkinii]
MHPFGLPEIRLHIAQYLSRHSLTVCARVSKDWQATFDPLIWQDINVRADYSSSSPFTTIPPVELVIQNAGWIHRHCCDYQVVAKGFRNKLFCTSLKSLDLSAYNNLSCHAGVLPDQIMIERHRDTLQELDLNFAPWNDSTEIWNVVGSCERLERLVVKQAMISPRNWSTCWRVWSQVRVVELYTYFYESTRNNGGGTQSISPWSTMTGCAPAKIQELKINLCAGVKDKDQVQWLKLCPDLTDLSWEIPMHVKPTVDPSPMKLLATVLREDNRSCVNDGSPQGPFCPNLISLTMNGCSYVEQDLVEYLRTRTRVGLKVLSLQQGAFGPESWKTILQGFSPLNLAALRTLNLRDSKQVTGAMAQEMMCSLSGLRVFSATTMTDADLLRDPRPWVCLGLTHLALEFELSPLESDFDSDVDSDDGDDDQVKNKDSATMARMNQRRLIMTQLGRLTALQILVTNERRQGYVHMNSRRGTMDTYYRLTLDFSLASGLDLLRGLRNLNKLSMINAWLSLSEEEIHWMVKHWPSLESVEAVLHPEDKTKDELMMMLREAKIQCSPQRYPSDGWVTLC